MGNERMTQPDHERPGMRPSQADDLVGQQPKHAGCGSYQQRFAGVLIAAQPADADQDRDGPDEPFRTKGGQRLRQSVRVFRCVEPQEECLVEMFQEVSRTDHWVTRDPATLASGKSCLSWSSRHRDPPCPRQTR